VEMLSVRIQGPATQNVGCCGGQAVEGNCGGLRSGDARQSAVGNRGGLRSGEERSSSVKKGHLVRATK
jgi:hypothetical protein